VILKKFFYVYLLGTIFISPFFINTTSIYSSFLYNNPQISLKQNENPLTGIKIGWITTHGENGNSTYLTTLNDAINMGASTTIITTEINNSLLNNFQIVVIEQGGTSWTTNELNALSTWVNSGGSVYILGDDLDPPQLNVSILFQIFYNETDPVAGNIVNLNHQYPILNGITSLFAFFPAASIDIGNTTNSLMNIALTDDLAVIVAALQVNQGRILVNIDADGMIHDSWIGGNDNNLFANNSWLWLAKVIGNGESNPPNPLPYYLLLIDSLKTEGLLSLILLTISLSILTFILILFFWRKRKK